MAGRLTIDQVHQVVTGVAGISSHFDAEKAAAATGMVESKGDPFAVGDQTLQDGPSLGLWQVLTGAHPTEAQQVQQIMTSTFGPSGSSGGGAAGSWGGEPDLVTVAGQEAQVLSQMFSDAVSAADQAISTLQAKGIQVTEDLAAGLFDAVWNHGAGAVLDWAQSTTDGLLEQIPSVNVTVQQLRQRYQDFLAEYRSLKAGAELVGEGVLLLLFALVWFLLKGRL